MKKIFTTIILTFILAISLAPLANAVYGIQQGPKNIPFKNETDEMLNQYNNPRTLEEEGIDPTSIAIQMIILRVADIVLYVAAPVAIAFIAYSGLSYVTARGEQESLDAAKKTLTWAILGLLLIIGSYGLVRLIIGTITSIPGGS